MYKPIQARIQRDISDFINFMKDNCINSYFIREQLKYLIYTRMKTIVKNETHWSPKNVLNPDLMDE